VSRASTVSRAGWLAGRVGRGKAAPAAGQACRVGEGSVVDRSRVLRFRFNGREYSGHPGDTLASALLANGVRLVARSFKYHRPRGIVAAGVEEPNALVQLGRGPASTPNLKATEIPLHEGLEAASVNCFPSLDHDVGAVNARLARLMPAGFYYKTFFGSPRLWHHVLEPAIRRAAGWGRAPAGEDPDAYERINAHCDVLVVGAGPAGIMAARAAAEAGARVILADENEALGGSLLDRRISLGGMSGPAWVSAQIGALAGRVRLLPRTTVFGYYDGNYLAALERCEGDAVRQRLWHLRAGAVVLATGAHERPLVFANNDRPGVMLAGAVQAYLNRWGVLAGRRLVLFTNNDRAYEAVLEARAAGAASALVVDARPAPEGPLVQAAREQGIEVLAGQAVVDTEGGAALRAVRIAALDADRGRTAGTARRIACDLLAVSGGYSPAVHLHTQAGGRLVYDEASACFRPGPIAQAARSAGGCNGAFTLAAAFEEGRDAGRAAAPGAGVPAPQIELPATDELRAEPPMPLWLVPGRGEGAHLGKHFVDLQNDTSAADIHLAAQEGFESVEHMKRYTLAGFGTDQGKTSNINALAILAGRLGLPVGEVGTTTFRPPYTPVTFAAMAGPDRGELFDPVRHTAMQAEHRAAGAELEDVGQWRRPWYYPAPRETMASAVSRECRAVRSGVGMLDASTLGKIEIQGPDAAELLNRVYINRWDNLAAGRVRYGVMLGEDGMVLDDGTTARLDEHRYLMTTTTAGAARVLDHLEDYLQTEWPALRVRLTSVTEQWATVALAGPHSRKVLARLAPALDCSAAGFPFMSWRQAAVAGLPARVFRVSFTGELQYEINVPWQFGGALWEAVAAAGADLGICPYGTEAMHVLRAEKGFIIVGQDTDGAQTPADLGMSRMVSTAKDFIGRRSLARADCLREDRQQLVGLLGPASGLVIAEGTQLVLPGTAADPPPVPMHGFVTSSYWSDALGRNICLALVAAGRRRHGETLHAAAPQGAVPVTLCDPVFYDPEGRRRDGTGD